jgi:hypothetical protein
MRQGLVAHPRRAPFPWGVTTAPGAGHLLTRPPLT